MTVDEAVKRVVAGAEFGTVYPRLKGAEDKLTFKLWWLGESGIPALGLRTKHPEYTGEACGRCGSLNLVRTGTCKTCQDCGDSSGGCG
jgi:hypothetical protein